MDVPKFCIGPMSKEVVDAVNEYTVESGNPVWFIPSRRQVEYNSGYVNNWSTKQFAKYIDKKNKIMRDHGGPWQGQKKDLGYFSLIYDSLFLDGVHIDPWKKHTSIKDCANKTVHLINFCNTINKNLFFEIGTEQAIRELSAYELYEFIKIVKKKLKPKVFDKILYLVIQSGTSLQQNKNTGIYNAERLKDMISICKMYDLKSKEHNGDYLSIQDIKSRFEGGLDTLNIAPEFGYLESKFILQNINAENKELLFNICHESKKWEKWVPKEFNPKENKEEIILISGHYVLSDTRVKNIVQHIPDFESRIKDIFKTRLKELHECVG